MPFDTPPPSYAPQVEEDSDTLTLRFGSLHIQSKMLKSAPDTLLLGYTRAMMAFLLLQPAPRDVLIVGLGGGSLSKFCHRMLPQTTVTTLEISQRVIALRDRFGVPADGPCFRVVHADAARYMRDQVAVADVILLDGFDQFGLPEALGTTTFYRHCHRALREGGVLAANLHNQSLAAHTSRNRIQRVFDGQTFCVSSVSSENRIVFGLKQLPPVAPAELTARATQLASVTDLPFRKYCQILLASAWGKAGMPLDTAT